MKNKFILGLLLLVCSNLQAQKSDNYFFFNIGGGFHNLTYSLKNGNEKGSFGYTLNGGYVWGLDSHWGIQSGLGINSFRPSSTLQFMNSSPSVDSDGTTYEYRTYYNNWKEEQQILCLDLPLGLLYRCSLNQNVQLVAAGGVKFFLPVKKKFQSLDGNIETTGYYSQWNVELTDLPQHGFLTLSDKQSGSISLKPSWGSFADLGMLYPLSSKIDLYAGGYINYGFTNILKSSENPVYQQDGVYNGVLESNQTDKAKIITIGVKVGIAWHHAKDKVYSGKSVNVPPISESKTDKVKEEPTEKVILQKNDVVIPEVDPIKAKVYLNAKTIAESILFVFNGNSEIDNDAKIIELSNILKENSDISIRILGHTFDEITHNTDYALGLKRAGIVRQKFLDQGVLSTQLIRGVIGFNELTTNKNVPNRIENGCVTIIVE